MNCKVRGVLTITEYKNEKGVENYFEEHLTVGEYHTEKGKSVGTWHGLTAAHLGLKEGAVIDKKDFASVIKGVSPKTGLSFLVRKKLNRVVAREMVFSAPKSVSILAITMEDHRLVTAHEHAVSDAFKELEKLVQTRVRRGHYINWDEKRTTGNLLAARFTHETSRHLDPQLHSHNVVLNITFDPVENRLKALDPHVIYNSAHYLTEVYRSSLAREVLDLGYKIEVSKHGWRIKGVPLEVERIFSKRMVEIEAEVSVIETTLGTKLTNNGKALIAGLTRKAKNRKISSRDYVSNQRSELTSDQLRALHQTVGASENRKSPDAPTLEKDARAIARDAVDYALDHVFERASVVHRRDLIKEALKHAMGRASLQDVEKEIQTPKFLHRGDWVMTREERQREILILDEVRSGKRKFVPLAYAYGQLDDKLDPNQKAALTTVLDSPDQYFYLRGAAGSGKTFVLSELHRAIGTHKSLYLAPSGAATETLRAEGFTNAQTIQRFLASDFMKRNCAGSLIVVDEAGLLSTKQVLSFIQIAKQQNARVLFVGDTLQHNSVEGGDALRLMEDYSVIQKTEIGKIRRQQDRIYRNAIQHLSKGEIEKGWEMLDQEMGAIHQVKGERRHEEVASEYVKALNEQKKVLIVCPTNDEIIQVNTCVRQLLKEKGRLGAHDRDLTVFKSLNFTKVEKKHHKKYDTSQYLSFHRNVGDFKQGEVWKVKNIDFGKVVLSKDGHADSEIIPAKQSYAYDVVYGDKKGFAVGELIQIRANYATSPANRVFNGSIAKISSFNDDGSIHLSNGKVLGSEFKQFTHGYAMTSQASQGKTVEKVILSAGSYSGRALSKNQFYVSCSRGTHELAIYTDDKEMLKKEIIRSSSRKLVLEELVRDRIIMKKIQATKIEMVKGVERSRDAIDRAFRKWKRIDPERSLRVRMEHILKTRTKSLNHKVAEVVF